MNPLALLLALIGGIGAMSLSSGSDDDTPADTADDTPTEDEVVTTGEDSSASGGSSGTTDQQDEPEPDPAPEDTPDPEPEEEPDPTPEPEEDPDPAPEPEDEPPAPPAEDDDTGSGSGNDNSGGETEPTVISDGVTEVYASRVATLAPEGDDITEVRILSGVDEGRVTVNPDNTFALVMTLSDFTGTQSFTYEATHADGSVTTHEVGLDVIPGLQDDGWGTGSSHYMLETDENDRVVVEHGDNHTKVYVSGSEDALSLSEIAATENMAIEDITGRWLAQNGYGQSEELVLDSEAGARLWSHVTPPFSDSSNWLLLERGYEYDDFERLVPRGASGESELNPIYVSAWGEGDAPEITNAQVIMQTPSHNVVFQDIHFSGGMAILDAQNILFDSVIVTDEEFFALHSDGITLRNSDVFDVARDASQNGGDWEAHADRIQGFFGNFIDGLLLEGNFFDHNGWTDGYDFNGDGDSGQAPSQFSHNIYLGATIEDVTLRDSIISRGASVGAQVRSGGYIEDNLFLDNNIALNALGGIDGDGSGSYTLYTGNVVTSAGYRDAHFIGALNWGAETRGELSALVDNIVTHLADPNNPEEQALKPKEGFSYIDQNHYYDDTIVYNWEGSDGNASESDIPERNTEGLDPAVLDQTTIQIFTAQLLGQETATIEDLANYLRAQADGAFDDVVDADLIIRFFQEGFGIAPDLRAEAETLRFVPNDLGDGVRWDNRLNWDTQDLPGTQDGDSVDLGGNHVIYGGTTEIDQLDFGDGGRLDFFHGKLTATGGLHADTEGQVEIVEAGQLWTNGTSGDGEINIGVGGGRFANTGQADNINLLATDGQTILASDNAEYDVSAGKTLAVFAEAAKVGFDGEEGGTAILDFHEGSTLAFGAEDGGLGTIEEFRSGAFGEETNVQSGIDLGDTTLEIDLSGLTAEAGNAFTLLDSDELIGLFNDATVGGLGARDATIVIDYVNDSVTLELTQGTGVVNIDTIGEETDVTAGEEALWAALTDGQSVADEALPQTTEEEEEDPLLVA